VIRQRLDIAGLGQIDQLGADGLPDLLAGTSVDLSQLAQGLGLPVDRIQASMISERYVSCTSFGEANRLR
jgi:hypothetical protein